jgi:hypothetical protein
VTQDELPDDRPFKSKCPSNDPPGLEEAGEASEALLENRSKPFGRKVKSPTPQEKATLGTRLGENPEESKRASRKVETGFLKKPTFRTFTLFFEGLPLWLLSLDRSFVSRVYICGFESSSELLCYLQNKELDPFLITKAAARLGLVRIEYLGLRSPPQDAIKLVSGAPPFLISEANRLGRSVALYLSSSELKRSYKFLPKVVSWHRCRHESFGGCTTFTALLGVGGIITGYRPVTTSIRRTIGHVLDHSVRPSPIANSTEMTSISLTVGSRLNPSDLGQTVRYRSNFYAKEWGSRTLTPDEIGLSFGLPTWLRGNKLERHHLPVVPIQILDGCLGGLFSDSFALKETLPTPLVRPPRVSSVTSWLPGIKKYLPHSWMKADTSPTKAVKSDDAGIPIHMWDQRILLVLPWVAPFLLFLR